MPGSLFGDPKSRFQISTKSRLARAKSRRDLHTVGTVDCISFRKMSGVLRLLAQIFGFAPVTPLSSHRVSVVSLHSSLHLYTWRLLCVPRQPATVSRGSSRAGMSCRETAGLGQHLVASGVGRGWPLERACLVRVARDPVQNRFEISSRSQNFSSERPNL